MRDVCTSVNPGDSLRQRLLERRLLGEKLIYQHSLFRAEVLLGQTECAVPIVIESRPVHTYEKPGVWIDFGRGLNSAPIR